MGVHIYDHKLVTIETKSNNRNNRNQVKKNIGHEVFHIVRHHGCLAPQFLFNVRYSRLYRVHHEKT